MPLASCIFSILHLKIQWLSAKMSAQWLFARFRSDRKTHENCVLFQPGSPYGLDNGSAVESGDDDNSNDSNGLKLKLFRSGNKGSFRVSWSALAPSYYLLCWFLWMRAAAALKTGVRVRASTSFLLSSSPFNLHLGYYKRSACFSPCLVVNVIYSEYNNFFHTYKLSWFLG